MEQMDVLISSNRKIDKNGPHFLNGTIGYNIIDLESGIPLALVAEIEAHPG